MQPQEAFKKALQRLNYTSGILAQYTKADAEYSAMKQKFQDGEVLSTRKPKHLKEVGTRKANLQTPLLNNQFAILKGFEADFTLACKALRKNEKLVTLFYKDLASKNDLDASFNKTLLQSFEKLNPGAIPQDELTAFSTTMADTIAKLKAAAPAGWVA